MLNEYTNDDGETIKEGDVIIHDRTYWLVELIYGDTALLVKPSDFFSRARLFMSEIRTQNLKKPADYETVKCNYLREIYNLYLKWMLAGPVNHISYNRLPLYVGDKVTAPSQYEHDGKERHCTIEKVSNYIHSVVVSFKDEDGIIRYRLKTDEFLIKEYAPPKELGDTVWYADE